MRIGIILAGLLLASVSIAMASIGLKFHGKIPDDKKDELGNNKTFLIVILVISCVLALGMMYMGFKTAKQAGLVPNIKMPARFQRGAAVKGA